MNGHNTKENFQKFKVYGNHKSAEANIKKYEATMVKDNQRDNIYVVDLELLDFIHHMHLTPKGLVDVDNKWKSDRLVFDSSFEPDPTSTSINNQVSKQTDGGVTFAGSFVQYLTWIWNMRISYPNSVILLGDNDVKYAFCLVKNNPAVVGMH